MAMTEAEIAAMNAGKAPRSLRESVKAHAKEEKADQKE